MTSAGISLSDAKKLIAQAEFDVKRKDCRERPHITYYDEGSI